MKHTCRTCEHCRVKKSMCRKTGKAVTLKKRGGCEKWSNGGAR